MRTYRCALILSLSAALCSAASFYNGQAARAVIGQNAFTDGYEPPTAASNILGGTSGLAYYNGLLYVADDNRLGATPQNDRIMIFDTRQIASPYADLTSVTTPSTRCHLCAYGAVGVLGQLDFGTTAIGRSAVPTSGVGSLSHPVAVATDGQYFAIADTDNNRVLLWNSIPNSPTVAPNIVLGQTNFTSFQSPQPVNANSLRGPQGVWISNGKLFVADTGNYRVLVWSSIPTRNNQPADFVLGQPNLLSAIHPPDSQQNPPTTASALSNPTGVSSDGTRLYVADLGYNRVLIWNTIPTSNGQPADVVIGQPSMTTSNSNNATAVCSSPTNDANGNPQYPFRCEATLSFPRFVLPSNGKLFIADSGNDRVLIFNSIPTTNGAKADIVLGQPDFVNNQVTNVQQSIASTTIDNSASVDTIQGPNSLAYDGANLYVSDPFNRRVVVYTPADTPLPNFSVLNWASEIIRQEGAVILTGTPVANDTATVTIAGTAYTYTVKTNDTLDLVAQGLVATINANAGDPNSTALFGGRGSGLVYLSSKNFNLGFDAISLAATTSNIANLVATVSNGYLTAGTAATGAPGTLVEINASAGQTLADSSATAATGQLSGALPTSLAGAQVFIDGIAAPLLRVSPSQIVAQLPYAVFDRSSISLYARTIRSNGAVTVTNPTPVYIAPANPGLFNAPAFAGQIRPWPALGALHQTTNPSAVVSVDGSVQANDVATISVGGRSYAHTVVAGETLVTIRDALINTINAAPDPQVVASAGGAFSRVVLTSRLPGAIGSGIGITTSSSTTATGGTVAVSLTPYSPTTCCNVPQGQPISAVSPALPGETIVLVGTGLGSIIYSDNVTPIQVSDFQPYLGPQPNTASQFVSATMGGTTAQVVSAGLPPYSNGVYNVQMIVPAGQAANNATQVYIAQNAYISNTVTIPVGVAAQTTTPVNTPQTTPPSLPSLIAGAVPALVSPAALVFGVQSLNNFALGSQAVTVQNTGGSALGIQGISFTGTNASDFQATQTCPSMLPGGSSCVLNVSYSPGGPGIRQATLVVATAAGVQRVLLTGATTSGFVITNQSTGKALEIPGGTSDVFTKVKQAEVSGQSNQRWTLVPVGSSIYAIMNVQTGQVLDVTGGSSDDFTPIQQFYYVGLTNQQWSIAAADNGTFVITNVGTGKSLDLSGGSFENGATIQQYTYIGSANQKWRFLVPQAFTIQNSYSSLILDVANASPNNMASIQQWYSTGLPEEQWLVIPIDATYSKIVNVLSGKALDVRGKSSAAFASIQQYDYFGSDNQLWALVPNQDGSFAIISKQSGMGLDVTGASLDAGTLVQQYNYLGLPNQKWTLIPAGLPGL